MVDVLALTTSYFSTWNAHDVAGIEALHAAESTLTDWDASHGPTNADVAKGIGGIWSAVPEIKIEIVDIYTCGKALSCVANINVRLWLSTCFCFSLRAHLATSRSDYEVTAFITDAVFDAASINLAHTRAISHRQVIVNKDTTLKVCDVLHWL